MSLDEARVRLILAGQLEQAVEDAGLACAASCRSLTTLAAQDFVRVSTATAPSHSANPIMSGLLDAIRRAAFSHSGPLHIRTPEGFAWYALYPDSYVQAACEWSRCVRPTARILVIGIRSIGTTLGAVVAAALALRGLDVERLTVRPHGHPFNRTTTLPADLQLADHAIIVDEGPGLSGSSMSSVAEALVARGMPRQAVTFFPGHDHGPGSEASPKVRAWWADIPRRCVTWDSLCFAGRPAGAVMAELAQSLLGEPLQGPLIDIGAGRWCKEASELKTVPYSAAPILEQPKLLARGRSGRALLFKFSGFSLAEARASQRLQTLAEAQASTLARLSESGLTVPPVACTHGWIVLPWLEGTRLRAGDADGDRVRQIGTHIGRVARSHLSRAEAETAYWRLAQLLTCNSKELLGDRKAQQALRVSDKLAPQITRLELPAYGDGRLAPHEWIRSGSTVIKTDAAGHHLDHTAVGPQPIWWDVAGASIEWDLKSAAREEIARRAGVSGAVIAAYYRAAYSSFRGGIAALCATQHDGCDRPHFNSALTYYSRHLERELEFLAERCTA